MRSPDQLPSVLLNLLSDPRLPHLVEQPTILANYLEHQGWAPLPEGMDDQASSLHSDSQDSAEQAEIMPLVEQKLEALALTPVQQETLKAALARTCPDCRETLEILMPTPSYAPT
jgi:hypothetical protein